MGRSVIALICGVVSAFAVVWLVEGLGHVVFPPPAGLMGGDRDAIAEAIADMPTAALLFPLGAWLLATVTGGLVACIIARRRPWTNALVVGGLVWAATLSNLIAIPHPTWMTIAALVGIPSMAVFAARTAPMMVAQESGGSGAR